MNKILNKKNIIILLILIALGIGSFFFYNNYCIKRIKIDTIDQVEAGYSKGCEGVSLYMALKYKGYMSDISLDQFMSTIPRDGNNPYLGFVGDLDKKTPGKRQTIYPLALTLWGMKYGSVNNITGTLAKDLLKYINKNNPVIIYVTANFNTPEWKTYDYGRVVTNGHVIILVGYNKITGDYLVNDCYKGKGEYWVKKKTFESIYNIRKYAVVIK